MGNAHRRWPWLSVLLAFGAPACQQTSKTYVVVDFKGTSTAPIYDIEIDLSLGSPNNPKADTVSFKRPSGGEIVLPTTAAVEIRSGEGQLDARARAYDGNGGWVAEGYDSVFVTAGKSASLHIVFTAPGRDAGADGPHSPDLATGPVDVPTKETPSPSGDGAGGTDGRSSTIGVDGAPASGGAGGTLAPVVDAAAGGSTGSTNPPGGAGGNAGGTTITLPSSGVGGNGGGGITSPLTGGDGGTGSGGTTVNGPLLIITPQPVDFGPVVVGSVSPPAALTVTNVGNQAAKPLAVFIGDGHRFPILADRDRCSGTALGPGFSCVVMFAFAPDAIGSLQTTGTITPDQGQPLSFVLLGRGLSNTPQITMMPNTVNFDILDVGLSNSIDFKVTSTGGVDPGTVSILLGGGNGFGVVNNGCDKISLPRDGRCFFTLMFIPLTFGKSQVAIDAKTSSGAAATSYATGIGRDFVNLTVKIAGTGSGTVVGNGLACSPSICTIAMARVDQTALPKFSLTARPDANSKFIGWSGPCTGTATCDGVMDTAKDITATFDRRSGSEPGTSATP